MKTNNERLKDALLINDERNSILFEKYWKIRIKNTENKVVNQAKVIMDICLLKDVTDLERVYIAYQSSTLIHSDSEGGVNHET